WSTPPRARVRSSDVAFKLRVKEVLYGVYERRLLRKMEGMQRPRHVGVILDGNRRWAKEAGLDASYGHRAGARKIADLLRWCNEAGVEVVTLWLLSTDNLNRSKEEIDALLEIIANEVDEITVPSQPLRVSHGLGLEILPATFSIRL